MRDHLIIHTKNGSTLAAEGADDYLAVLEQLKALGPEAFLEFKSMYDGEPIALKNEQIVGLEVWTARGAFTAARMDAEHEAKEDVIRQEVNPDWKRGDRY